MVNPTNRQSTKKHNTYKLLEMYSIPPDDGLQICPKHVEFDLQNKLRINSASSWFLLHRFIETRGQRNIKSEKLVGSKGKEFNIWSRGTRLEFRCGRQISFLNFSVLTQSL
jgi:hypothetical protein